MKATQVLLLLLICLSMYITATNAKLCERVGLNSTFCKLDDVSPVDYYTCGGEVTFDNFNMGITSNKVCAPTIGNMAPDSPCTKLYSYPEGVSLCWGQLGYTTIKLDQWSEKAWATQIKNVEDTYSMCKDGRLTKPWSSINPREHERSGAGFACCDSWYNLEVNMNWCHSLECWCPRPCSSPPKKVSTPGYFLYTYESQGFCYSDCTDCLNIDFGARSRAVCNGGSIDNWLAIAPENSCSCCRTMGGTYQSGAQPQSAQGGNINVVAASSSSRPSATRSPAVAASKSSQPSASRQPSGSSAASRTSNPSASRTSNPSASRTSNPSASKTSNPSASRNSNPSASRTSNPSASRQPAKSAAPFGSKTSLPSASKTRFPSASSTRRL